MLMRGQARSDALVANDAGVPRVSLFRGGGNVFPGLRP